MTQLIGHYHKMRMRCDFCGQANPNGSTFVINTDEIKGQFCHESHAQEAWKEMKKEQGGDIDEDI